MSVYRYVAGEVIMDTGSAMEKIVGECSYLDVLQQVHQRLRPRFYLEVGVRQGASLRLAKCAAVGIDPSPRISTELYAGVRVFRTTSDDFFESTVVQTLPPIDMAFIDGMHLSEYALRDFINIERLSSPSSVILFDDISPNHVAQATRSRTTAVWTGDIWKIVELMALFRPDLVLLRLNSFPTGLLLVTNLNPCSQVLRQNLSKISTLLETDIVPGTMVLNRFKSISPAAPAVVSLFDLLRKQVNGDAGSLPFADRIQQWRVEFRI
jgi:hypothetical protein